MAGFSTAPLAISAQSSISAVTTVLAKSDADKALDDLITKVPLVVVGAFFALVVLNFFQSLFKRG